MAHRDDSGPERRAQRQRLGHGGADRARALLRPDCRRAADLASVHARLPLDRRRGRRRARRRPLRRRAGRARERHRRHQSRLDRRRPAGRGSSFGGDTARSPAPGLVETVRSALAQEGRRRAGAAERPPAARRASGFPFNPYEQAPFVSRGIPAVTITTGRRAAARTSADAPDEARRQASRRRSAARRRTRVDAMEQGVSLAQGPSSYVFLGQRLIRGWAIEIVLVAMLLPFLAAAVDLFARCRRRRIRDRAGAAQLSQPARLLGLGRRALPPLQRGSASGGSGDGRAAVPERRPLARRRAGRARAARRRRLARRPRAGSCPRRPIRAGGASSPATAPHCSRWASSACSSRRRIRSRSSSSSPRSTRGSGCRRCRPPSGAARERRPALGFAGPGLSRLDVRHPLRARLGRAVVHRELFAVGYAPLPLFVIGLAWLAAAGQLVALAADRYAPYPAPGERPRRGPLRELIRTLVLAQRRRAAAADAATARSTSQPRRSQRTVEPAASSPFPRGTWTSASAALARTIMCDSWPRDRLEHDARRRRPATRARTNSSRSSFRAQADRERARLEARQRIREALQRAQRGLDEELAADERRDRVPRQAEDERLAAHAERDRLARLDRDAPEDLLDAELPLDRADEIVLADRDAARGDEDVGREPALERCRSAASSSATAGAGRRPRRRTRRARRRA